MAFSPASVARLWHWLIPARGPKGMTHGIGWISVALVVVATWEPLYVLPAVLLYGSAQVLAMTLQVSGVDVSPYLLDMIPYVVALAVMAFFANSKARRNAARA